MKLKQEIISLLSHFDDDGNILPNKIVTFKIASTDSFAPSQCKRVDSLIGCMAEGNEYRIEDAPKRPREVWINFRNDGSTNHWFSRNAAHRYAQKGNTPIRFIEATPREVTDADVQEAFEIESVALKLRKPIKEVMWSILQHYENERGK